MHHSTFTGEGEMKLAATVIYMGLCATASAQVTDLEQLVRQRAVQSGWSFGGILNTDFFNYRIPSWKIETQNPSLRPIIIAKTTIINDTDGAGDQTFNDTKTTTDTITRTTQNAVKFGIKIEAKLDYFFAGGSVSGSFENSFTDTKTQTNTKNSHLDLECEASAP